MTATAAVNYFVDVQDVYGRRNEVPLSYYRDYVKRLISGTQTLTYAAQTRDEAGTSRARYPAIATSCRLQPRDAHQHLDLSGGGTAIWLQGHSQPRGVGWYL